MIKRSIAAAIVTIGLIVAASSAHAFKLGIIAFQMSSETHARVANAAAEAAKDLGWTGADPQLRGQPARSTPSRSKR